MSAEQALINEKAAGEGASQYNRPIYLWRFITPQPLTISGSATDHQSPDRASNYQQTDKECGPIHVPPPGYR
jgi:hypothetical protein